MNMKKKVVIMLLIILFIIPFIPGPAVVFRDGGTKVYSAIAYKLVSWNRLTENGVYHKTKLYWFPKNLKGIDELWIEEYGKEDREMFNKIAGRTFCWEKEGFGSDFTVSFKPDGTYAYYEGVLSSYIGMGTWSVKDGIITMAETGGYDFIYHFAIDGDDIVYIARNSSKFIYSHVEDGDRFIPAE